LVSLLTDVADDAGHDACSSDEAEAQE
jgi:hypothetical protein